MLARSALCISRLLWQSHLILTHQTAYPSPLNRFEADLQTQEIQGLSPLKVSVWLVFTLLAGLVFFWPDRTIAHVDDLFFIPWATSYAENREHINPLLAVQFPGLENYHLYTRFHLIFTGLFLDAFGTSTASVVGYEFLCYVLTVFAFSTLCVVLRLPRAAVFAPVLFAPMYVVSGLRLEVTACVFMTFGLLFLFAAARWQQSGAGAAQVSGLRTLAKLLLAFAPLASPAVFAWCLGAILVHDIWRLWFRQARVLTVFAENAVALALGLLIFSLSIEFQYENFLEQFIYHSSRSTGGGVNGEALGRGALFAALGLLLVRQSREVALFCICLGAGQALGAVLHDKVLVRNLAASMVFLAFVDVLTRVWLRPATYVLYTAVFLVVSANFLSFYVFSQPAAGVDKAVADYRKDVEAGNRVFIDETMAHHYLDQQTTGAIAWTWGREFPKARAETLDELGPDDVWYLSPYTLYSYLKGNIGIARDLAPDVAYWTTPYGPCVMGRHSCRLPATRWEMLRLERDGDLVIVYDPDEDRRFDVVSQP